MAEQESKIKNLAKDLIKESHQETESQIGEYTQLTNLPANIRERIIASAKTREVEYANTLTAIAERSEKRIEKIKNS